MAIPLDIIEIAAVAVAILVGWFESYTRLIHEKIGDLKAGQEKRTKFVESSLERLTKAYLSSKETIDKLAKSADPVLTKELWAKLGETEEVLDEIETIRDADKIIVSRMRRIRGQVVLVGAISSITVPVFVEATLNPTWQFSPEVEILALLFTYSVFMLIGMRILRRNREAKEVEMLLKKNDIYEIGE